MERLFYKRHINKSVLWDGFGIEQEYLSFFLDGTPSMKRGEKRPVQFIFQGSSFNVKIYNLNNPANKRKTDSYQIRYTAGGDFAKALQKVFYKTYNYIQEVQAIEPQKQVIIPKDYQEFLAIYTTEQKDVYYCEPILRDDIQALKETVKFESERHFESIFNFEMEDKSATIRNKEMLVRVRKLNRKIGDYLKEKYDYRCQICGRKIGEMYGSNLVEAHHIDYFVKSLNNDSSNQMILCPNHHGIIHDMNPVFDRDKLIYTYPNGFREGLKLNFHL